MKTIKQLEKELRELKEIKRKERIDDFVVQNPEIIKLFEVQLSQTKEIVKMIEEFKFPCCENEIEECHRTEKVKKELLAKIKGEEK